MSKDETFNWRCPTCAEYASGPNERAVTAAKAGHKCKKGVKK